MTYPQYEDFGYHSRAERETTLEERKARYDFSFNGGLPFWLAIGSICWNASYDIGDGESMRFYKSFGSYPPFEDR